MPEKKIEYYLKIINDLLNSNYPSQHEKIIKTLLTNVDIALYGAGGRLYFPMGILIKINVELLIELLTEIKMLEYLNVLKELLEENEKRNREIN